MTKTRFAPSPTGNLHIGSARTAIVSWLIAQKLEGKFLLRIEDTDLERSKPEYTKNMLDSLTWLNLAYDEGPYYQTQRFDRYKEVALELVKSGKAYYCYATAEELAKEREDYKQKFGHDGWKYQGKWRDFNGFPPEGVKPVIRLKVPLDGDTQWNDLVKGGISIPNKQMDDLIILRSDGTPTYNFCVVVDDSDMNVSHVIRGEDHVNNTPKQIQIYKSLEKEIPVFGHVPLILNLDGSKQSKRENANEVKSDDGEIKPMTNLTYYKNKGFLPEAMINYLLLITCNDLPKEIFTKEEFVDFFKIDKLGNTPIKFDLNKLIWINQQHMKLINNDVFINKLMPQLSIWSSENSKDFNEIKDINFNVLQKSIIERSKTTNDFIKLLEPVLKTDISNIKNNSVLKESFERLIQLDDFNSTSIYNCLKSYCEEKGIKIKDLMQPLRVDVFNNLTLPIAEAIEAIGKDKFEKLLISKKLKI
jgi:glutamyl-tRNA synthetase